MASTATGATTLIEQFGTLETSYNAWDSSLLFGAAYVLFNVFVHYFKKADSHPKFYAYLANTAVLTTTQLSAAYAVMKCVAAVTSTAGKQWYTYSATSQDFGNSIGAAETLAILGYLAWAGALSYGGAYIAMIMWLNIDKAGSSFGNLEGYKYMTVGLLISAGSWIATIALGEQAANLLSIYDTYSYVSNASALFIDMSIHGVMEAFNLIVLTAIAGLGFVVAIFILGADLDYLGDDMPRLTAAEDAL